MLFSPRPGSAAARARSADRLLGVLIPAYAAVSQRYRETRLTMRHRGRLLTGQSGAAASPGVSERAFLGSYPGRAEWRRRTALGGRPAGVQSRHDVGYHRKGPENHD